MDQNNIEFLECSQKIYEKKSLIYYEHLLDSLITMRMEYDKSLLLISMGGVGLLTTLLMTVPGLSFCNVLFFMFSIFFLLVSGIIVACTFNINSSYTKYILADLTVEAEAEEKKLDFFQCIAIFAFSLGVVLALGLGAVLAFHQF